MTQSWVSQPGCVRSYPKELCLNFTMQRLDIDLANLIGRESTLSNASFIYVPPDEISKAAVGWRCAGFLSHKLRFTSAELK